MPACHCRDSREAIYEAIRQNLGARVVPAGEVPRDPALRIVPFAQRPPVLHEYLYCLESRRHTRLVGAFLECVEALAPDQQAQAATPPPSAYIGAMSERTAFAEYEQLLGLLDAGSRMLDTRAVCETSVRGHRFSVYAATVGATAADAPAIGIFGGIHGLERIGTQLVLDYLRSLLCRLEWDELLHEELQAVRLVFMPIVNPGGMWAATRANPNGVDLMRNAPQDADARVPFLAGGQRIGAWLPWFRGPAGHPMEAESQALLSVVQGELLSRPLSFAVDCHSGYGWRDSIWFPYARTHCPMPHLPEMYLLKTMFEQAHPHHGYAFEPQSHQYLLHGDLWDYAYDLAPPQNLFLPMTLELGSWLWIKKNPRQLFSRDGIFNPIKAHRTARVLRRHVSLFDFLGRIAFAPQRWLPTGERRAQLQEQAQAHWRQRPKP